MPGLNLTRDEARTRAAILQVENYDVTLDLDGEGETFRSQTTLTFTAKKGKSVFVDMVAAKVHSMSLNGKPLPADAYADNRLQLEDLAEQNTLVVDADFYYMNTGEGMHRSVDPADGETYLYTQFEVPDARRVFPTFEQPDLKATFTFTVTVPKKWEVFSVSPTPEPTIEGDKATYRFAPTPRISTYITAILAGPYRGESRTIRSTDGREIELGVYARASLLPSLDAGNIMDVTEAGFQFFEDAYGIPYPFLKYDQVFVPEFNAGAMENAGLVTIRDQFVFRSRPTDWDLEERANVILHELAHMWFGNLVTMRWWDDLWLNESFAEYMAHLATAEATQWKDAWVGFTGRKEWGLAQDQKPSTHPVKADMRDLNDVEVNFDGITYAKGAAVLRQMVAYVGRENFFKGLHQYLSKHSFDNATLEDLLTELETTSGRDMSAWTKVWIEQAGVTTLRPSIEVDPAGNISELVVLQEAPSPDQVGFEIDLRPHRMIVSGYSLNEDGTKVERVFSEELDVDGGATEVKAALGLPRPDLILVNDQDLAYAKVRLDEDSFAFARDNIEKIDDALTRRVLLGAAWDMTRDGELSATQFLALALRDAAVEDSVATLTTLLRQVDTAVSLYVSPAHRGAQLQVVADGLEALVEQSEPGSDYQELLVRAFARRAVTRAQYQRIQELFDGGSTGFAEGLSVGVDLAWQFLFALVRGGLAGEKEIAKQLQADPTLTGEENAAQARATIDSDAVRQKTWDAIMHDTSIPNDTRWAMAAGFWAHATTNPLEYVRYVRPYFDQLVHVWDHHTFQIAGRLVTVMDPLPLVGYVPELNIVALATDWLEGHQERPDSLRRLVIEGRSDAERMLNAQRA